MSKMTIGLEIENPNEQFSSYFFDSLSLPATDNEIRDVLHRIRIYNGHLLPSQFSVYDCDLIPNLVGSRMDSPTLDEMNFLAKRLAQLNEDEVAVLKAIAPRYVTGFDDNIVSIKDLINMTYGLQSVSVISGVSNDKQLGVFVIENDLHGDVESVPYHARYLLDKEAIGRLQRAADDGVFIGDTYVVTADFELPKVYDGITLPESAPETYYAFRLLIDKAPHDDVHIAENAEWISLPMSDGDMAAVAHRHGVQSLEDCVYYNFESSIPQITSEDFTSMRDIKELNELAKRMADMAPCEKITFKAALEVGKENGVTFDDICNISQNLFRYEMATNCGNPSDFFKEYLLVHMDSKFDETWLNRLNCRNEGQNLLRKLGATCTEYGVISAWGESLYRLVPYNEQQQDTPAETEDASLEEDEGMGMTMQ